MYELEKLFEAVNLLRENVKCCICLDTLNDAVTTDCSHHFCSVCFKGLVNGRRRASCPICNSSVTRRSVFKNDVLGNVVECVTRLVTSIKLDSGIDFTEEVIHPQSMKVSLSTQPIYQNVQVTDTHLEDVFVVSTSKNDDKQACDNLASTHLVNAAEIDSIEDTNKEESKKMKGKQIQWTKRYSKRYPGKCQKRENLWNSILFPGEIMEPITKEDLNASKLPPTVKVQKWLETNESELKVCDKSVIQGLMSGSLPKPCEVPNQSLSEDDDLFLSVSQAPLYPNADNTMVCNFRNKQNEVPLVSLNNNGMDPDNDLESSKTDPYKFISSQKSKINTNKITKKRKIKRKTEPLWKNMSCVIKDYVKKRNNKNVTKVADNSIFCANIDPNNTFDNLLEDAHKTEIKNQRNVQNITEKEHCRNAMLNLPKPKASQSSNTCYIDMNNTFDNLLATTTRPKITTVKDTVTTTDDTDEIYIFKSLTELVDKLDTAPKSAKFPITDDEYVKTKGRKKGPRYPTRSRTSRKLSKRLSNIKENENAALESLTNVFAEVEVHGLLTSSQADRDMPLALTMKENDSYNKDAPFIINETAVDLQRESSKGIVRNTELSVVEGIDKIDNRIEVADQINSLNTSIFVASPGWSHLAQLKKDFKSPKKPALKVLDVSLSSVCPKKNVTFVENNLGEQCSSPTEPSPAIDDESPILKVNHNSPRRLETLPLTVPIHAGWIDKEACYSKPYKNATEFGINTSLLSTVNCLLPNPKDDLEVKAMTSIIHSAETEIQHADSVTKFYQQRLRMENDEIHANIDPGDIRHVNIPMIISESEDVPEKDDATIMKKDDCATVMKKDDCVTVVEKVDEHYLCLGSEMEQNALIEKLQQDQTSPERTESTVAILQNSVDAHKISLSDDKENINIYKYADDKGNYQTPSKCIDHDKDMTNIIPNVDINKFNNRKIEVSPIDKMACKKNAVFEKDKIIALEKNENIAYNILESLKKSEKGYCYNSLEATNTTNNDTNIKMSSLPGSIIAREVNIPIVCDPIASSNMFSNTATSRSSETVNSFNNQEIKCKHVNNTTTLKQGVPFLKLGSVRCNRQTHITRFIVLGSLVPKRKRHLSSTDHRSQSIPLISWEREKDLPEPKRHCSRPDYFHSGLKATGNITPPATHARDVEVQITPSLKNRLTASLTVDETIQKVSQTRSLYFLPGIIQVPKDQDSLPQNTDSCIPDSFAFEYKAPVFSTQLSGNCSLISEKNAHMASFSDNELVPELRDETESFSLHDLNAKEKIAKENECTFKESKEQMVDVNGELIFDKTCSQHNQIRTPETHTEKMEHHYSLNENRNNSTVEIGKRKVSQVDSVMGQEESKRETDIHVELESDTEPEVVDLIGSDDASENFIPGTCESHKCDNPDTFGNDDESLQKIDNFIKEDMGLAKDNRNQETKCLDTKIDVISLTVEKMAKDEMLQEVLPRWNSPIRNNNQTPKQHAALNDSFMLSEDIVEATPPKQESSLKREMKSKVTLSGPKISLIHTDKIAESDASPNTRLTNQLTPRIVELSSHQSPVPMVQGNVPQSTPRFHNGTNVASAQSDKHSPSTQITVRPEICSNKVLEQPPLIAVTSVESTSEPKKPESTALGVVQWHLAGNINSECISPAAMSAIRHTPNNSDKETKQAVFVCSGLQPDLTGRVKALARIVGAKFSDVFTEEITHLVVMVNEEGKTTKTLKYIQTVASGKWVVAFAWVNASLKVKAMVPEVEFEALDSSGYSGPQMSRLRSGPLFMDFTFYWSKPISSIPSCTLKEVLTLCGGNIVDMPVKFNKKPGHYFIYLVERLEDTEGGHIVEMLQCHHAVTVSSDWVLDCIGCWQLISLMGYVSENLSQDDLRRYNYPEDLLVDEEDEDDNDQDTTVD